MPEELCRNSTSGGACSQGVLQLRNGLAAKHSPGRSDPSSTVAGRQGEAAGPPSKVSVEHCFVRMGLSVCLWELGMAGFAH